MSFLTFQLGETTLYLVRTGADKLPPDKMVTLGEVLTCLLIFCQAALNLYNQYKDPNRPRPLARAGKVNVLLVIVLTVAAAVAYGFEKYGQHKLDLKAKQEAEETKQQAEARARKDLQDQFGPMLQQIGKVQDGLKDLDTGLNAATAKLQRGTEQTAKAIQQNGQETLDQGRRAQEILRDAQVSEIRFRTAWLELELPGAKPPVSPLLSATRAAGEANLEADEIRRCKAQNDTTAHAPTVDCRKAARVRKEWSDTFGFFAYLDPENRLDLQIDLRLAAFDFRIRTTTKPVGDHDLIRVHEFETKRTDRYSLFSPVEQVGGSTSPSLALSLNPEYGKYNTAEIGPYSRELNLTSFGVPFAVKVCDHRLQSEGEAVVKRHLLEFPSDQVWILTVKGYRIANAEYAAPIVRDYVLKPTNRTESSDCVTIDYQ